MKELYRSEGCVIMRIHGDKEVPAALIFMQKRCNSKDGTMTAMSSV